MEKISANHNLRTISIAHSPDSDDAFMFYALAETKIKTNGLVIKQVMKDIESLNREALVGRYEVTAVSFAAYPNICQHYQLLVSGSSMGENYGPILVSRRTMLPNEISNMRIAIPGKYTSAYMCLRLYEPNLDVIEMPFNQILEAVSNNEVDAGLLIHEGQLTYQKLGLNKILDLGKWWQMETGLPLPLGGNAIKRDLGFELKSCLAKLIKEAILYALSHRREALAYAMTFARDMPIDVTDKYVGMYVNELTVDCGENGRKAVQTFYDWAFEKGVLPEKTVADFVS